MVMNLNKLWDMVKDREAWSAVVHRGDKESDTAERLNNKNNNNNGWSKHSGNVSDRYLILFLPLCLAHQWIHDKGLINIHCATMPGVGT